MDKPLKIQRTFPLRYRLKAGRALNGSLSDLFALASAIIYGQLPLTRDVLSLFLYHLRTPSNGDPPRSLEIVELVFGRLTDIFITVKFAERHPDISITSSISEAWPDICSSLLELHHHTHPGVRVNPAPGPSVPSLILLFLTTVLRWPPAKFSQSPHQLEVVMSILIDIWTTEAESNAINLDVSAATALAVLIQRVRLADPVAHLERVLLFIAHFDTKYALAILLLKRLSTSVRSQPSKTHFELEASLITMVRTADEQLEAHLLGRSSIRKYATALGYLLSLPADPGLANSILYCLEYFTATLNATNGVPWVAQALRAGILPALLQCAESYSGRGDVSEEIVKLLTYTIPRYLVYKSILREALKSLAHIHSAELARSQYWSTAARIPKVWRDFVALVAERNNIIKDEYDKDVKYPPCSQCGQDTIVNRNACSGCMCVRYCSTDCQRQNWNTHKLLCEHMRNTHGNELIYRSGSVEDRRFFNGIITYDLLKNQARIREQRSVLLQRNPQLINLPFSVRMDYDFIPVKITVVSFNPHEFNMRPSPGFQNDATSVVAKRGVETYVEIYIPSGRGHTSHPAMSEILGDWDRVTG
ncbi:hypothetical protein C8R46DRAFT_1076074 [Mycena filopes]|nr:hypothetical protein C8R46DRAFT_1076074 [Mycena filopes]